MFHLVHECPGVIRANGGPAVRELGDNFGLLGHVRQPAFIARRRLLQLDANTIRPSGPLDPHSSRDVWKEGCVVFGDTVWEATGAYAVLDAQCNVIPQKLVIVGVHARGKAQTRLRIFSDCQDVVRGFSSQGILLTRRGSFSTGGVTLQNSFVCGPQRLTMPILY